MGISGQGQAYRVPKWIKGVKLELGTEKVIEMKQGSFRNENGTRGSKVGVLVWGCTECNILVMSTCAIYHVDGIQEMCNEW